MFGLTSEYATTPSVILVEKDKRALEKKQTMRIIMITTTHTIRHNCSLIFLATSTATTINTKSSFFI